MKEDAFRYVKIMDASVVRLTTGLYLGMVLLLTGNGLTRTVSSDVPLHHPVYQYMGMLPLPPRIGTITLSGRPFTEAQICSVLVYAEETERCSDTALNRFFLRQFSAGEGGEARIKTPLSLFLNDHNTRAYPYVYTSSQVRDSNFTRAGFSAARVDSISTETETYNITRIGARLHASVYDVLFYVDAAIITEYSSLTVWEKAMDPRQGVFQTPILTDNGAPGHFMGYDAFRAYVKAPLPWFDLKMGNDRVAWGYADTSGLLFSGSGSPFLHLKLDKALGKLNYSFVYGRLIGDAYDERRMVYAKHIAYSPAPWLSLGFSDAVITVDRNFVLMYWFPFVPFYFTEHYLGDQDNRIMSFDGMVHFRKRFSLYGELFLDDISNLLAVVTNDSWGDKWGALVGLKAHDPLPFLPASMIRAELLQTEPWVYTTSSRPDQAAHNYPVHFGSPLGTCLGPHSRMLTLNCAGRISTAFEAEAGIRHFWKGRGEGSSMFDENPLVKDTVAGTVVIARKYETKEHRFREYDRNRTVVSAALKAFVSGFMQVELCGDVALEREPSSARLFRAGMNVWLNY